MAISNQRLVGLEGDDVLFRYKDRADDDRWKILRLPAHEFIRRFLLHVLPDRFVRIRYFGVAFSPAAEPIVESWSHRLLRFTGFDALWCPFCKADRLHPVSSLSSIAGSAPQGPP